jgi:hypothetical protein
MTMEKLENIPVSPNISEIKKRLHMEKGENWSQVQPLIEMARPLIKARAVYKVSYIDTKVEDAITVDGVRFSSRVLRKQVDNVERIFPYVITIGHDLEEKAGASEDLLEQFYLDTIANVALVTARKNLEDQLKSRYALDGMSYMSPGSLVDWPIQEQRPLFSILGDVEGAIGVALNESLLMIPRKSISGIYFATETRFFSCQLCPREACPSRKARYSEKLAREYGLLK